MTIDFHQFVGLAFCILFPLFWLFFIYEEDHGPLGRSEIPGDLGVYFLGEAYEFFQDPLDFAYSRFAKHGMIFKTKLLGHGVVFVRGSKGLELFSSGPEKGLGASPESFLFDLPAHNFNCNVNNHKRSVLMSENDFQHGFKHLAVLASITSLCNRKEFFNDCKEVIMKFMSTQSTFKRPISGAKLCKDIFLQISVKVLMKDTVHKNQLKELLDRWLRMQNIFPFSPLGLNRSWESGKQSTSELDDLVTKEVKSRLGSDRDFGNDLIGCMLETAMRRTDGYGKTLENIIEKTVIAECWTVIYSLSVQVAGACCWLLVCFERFKNIKEAALTEIRNCPNCLKFDTIRGEGSLPYLEAIIEESLRMYGFLSNPQLRRVALLDIQFENYTIPKGTPVILPLHSCNFLEEQFSDPHLFQPERFLNIKSRSGGYLSSNDVKSESFDEKRKTSYSFGVGHHTCPGDILARMMLKLVAVSLLEQFDTTSETTQSFKPVYPRGKKEKRSKNWSWSWNWSQKTNTYTEEEEEGIHVAYTSTNTSTNTSTSTSSTSCHVTAAENEDFFFPVPEDLLRYESFISRRSLSSSQHQDE